MEEKEEEELENRCKLVQCIGLAVVEKVVVGLIGHMLCVVTAWENVWERRRSQGTCAHVPMI